MSGGFLCFPMYLPHSSSPMSSDIARSMRFLGPAICAGLVTSIGHGWMFSRSSSSPGMQMLSPSFEIWTDLVGDSRQVFWRRFFLGDGVVGNLFPDDSAVFADMSFSRFRRCSRSRIDSCSCVSPHFRHLFLSPSRFPCLCLVLCVFWQALFAVLQAGGFSVSFLVFLCFSSSALADFVLKLLFLFSPCECFVSISACPPRSFPCCIRCFPISVSRFFSVSQFSPVPLLSSSFVANRVGFLLMSPHFGRALVSPACLVPPPRFLFQ